MKKWLLPQWVLSRRWRPFWPWIQNYLLWLVQSLKTQAQMRNHVKEIFLIKRKVFHATWLQGNHFPPSMYPRRGVSRACEYKKRKSKTRKRPAITVKNVKCSFVRNALKVSTPRVRSEHHWLKLRNFHKHFLRFFDVNFL